MYKLGTLVTQTRNRFMAH